MKTPEEPQLLISFGTGTGVLERKQHIAVRPQTMIIGTLFLTDTLARHDAVICGSTCCACHCTKRVGYGNHDYCRIYVYQVHPLYLSWVCVWLKHQGIRSVALAAF